MRARQLALALALAIPAAGASLPATAAGADAPAELVTVDARATGTPISPLVYGQFIEHLGRCIYGGLWAEMLEDRKFFYPVTGEAPAWELFTPGPRSFDGEGHPYELLMRSPWMVIGDKQAVTMVREGALAGEHSPRLAVGPQPVGLLQERLALRDGREYVGRVVLAGDPAVSVDVSLAWGSGASDRQTITLENLAVAWSTHPLRFRAGTSTDGGRLSIVGRVVLGGDPAVSVDVSLAWGSGASDRRTITLEGLAAGWSTHPLRFRAGTSTDGGRLSIVGRGSGSFRVGAV
ncbi:MAG: hypothetical protein ACM3PV_07530, partial [Betaproteobacteria bacterium]